MGATERARVGIRYLRRAILCAAFVIALAFPYKAAHAEDYAGANAYIHAFNNDITVYSAVFSLNRDFTLSTTGYFKYTVDMINPELFSGEGDEDEEGEGARVSKSAVAAVSGASGSANSETRHEITAAINHSLGNIASIEAGYDLSVESDYLSHTPSLAIKKDLFEKNTTLTFGYSRNMDTVSGKYLSADEEKTSDNYFLGVTQVLSKVTVAQVGYSRNETSGYLGEGTRLVGIDGTLTADCTDLSATCVNEVFPDSRSRGAYLVGINHYFPGDSIGVTGLLGRSAVKLNFRYYDDDWDIRSYTGEAEYYRYLSEDLILRLNYRHYDQSAAFFVKGAYATIDTFKSASPQYEEFTSDLIGVKLVKYLSNLTRFYEGKGLVEGKYEFYTQSTGVNAHVLMGGVRLMF